MDNLFSSRMLMQIDEQNVEGKTVIVVASVPDLCRCCLSSYAPNNIFEMEFEGTPFSIILSAVFGFTMSYDHDELSKKICTDCINKILYFYDFRKKFYRSQTKLFDMYNSYLASEACHTKETTKPQVKHPMKPPAIPIPRVANYRNRNKNKDIKVFTNNVRESVIKKLPKSNLHEKSYISTKVYTCEIIKDEKCDNDYYQIESEDKKLDLEMIKDEIVIKEESLNIVKNIENDFCTTVVKEEVKNKEFKLQDSCEERLLEQHLQEQLKNNLDKQIKQESNSSME